MRKAAEIAVEIVENAEGEAGQSKRRLDAEIVEEMIAAMAECGGDPQKIGEVWIEVVRVRQTLLVWWARQ